ncbi:hypothetical protein PG993_010877 [Apiospora rasikravindrae]|uniref:Uncharacterized protein n=1 Tax=Apiospora rasikravindrae TaxID=990691 RepID=A0ABR1SCL8_9PEZI
MWTTSGSLYMTKPLHPETHGQNTQPDYRPGERPHGDHDRPTLRMLLLGGVLSNLTAALRPRAIQEPSLGRVLPRARVRRRHLGDLAGKRLVGAATEDAAAVDVVGAFLAV